MNRRLFQIALIGGAQRCLVLRGKCCYPCVGSGLSFVFGDLPRLLVERVTVAGRLGRGGWVRSERQHEERHDEENTKYSLPVTSLPRLCIALCRYHVAGRSIWDRLGASSKLTTMCYSGGR